jgi:multimeric flavodoxin WrbA
MNIIGISFSYAKNSMNTRGLKLMTLDSVYDMNDFNMPMCNVNKADGRVAPGVNKFIDKLIEANVLVFAIPEATAHYSAGFKNAMDWLICASNFNADLGQDGPFFNKPIYVITFTPVISNAGDRHFEMTKHLLEDKMGGIVYNSFVKHSGWKECVPGNYEWVRKEHEEILNTKMPEPHPRYDDWKDKPNTWIEQYKIWEEQWKES